MKTLRLPLLTIFTILILFPKPVSAQEPHKFIYVSTEGNDRSSGSLDSPLKSFEAAQSIVKSYRDDHLDTPVTVYFRGGKYYRTRPIIFTNMDSGSEHAPITYKAYPNETPLILGGKKLKLKWEKHKGGIFKARIPQDIIFESLYINDKEQVLARYPNFNPDIRTFNGTAEDCISKERVAGWKNPANGYFHVIHGALWGGFHFKITGKDKKGELTMEGGWQNNRPENGLHKKLRYVENIFEELDVENEWYLDRDKSVLYLKPEAGLDLENANIEVAYLENFINLEGTIEEPVKYISFEGFTFNRSIRTFMKTKEPLLRSDWTIYRGGAILFKGTENCSVINCSFSQLGGNAFFASAYNKNTRVEGNHIFNIGASGISFVGETSAVRNALYNPYGPPTKESELDHSTGPLHWNIPQNCTAHNNLIHDIGRVEKQVAGVQISVAYEITISHNSIYNCPRSGINVSEGAFGGHLFEFNDVFNTVLETSDHGSFNSWGRDRFWMAGNKRTEEIVDKYPELIFADLLKPTIIRNNRMSCEHGWDIDLDDGSSYYEIYNNLCLQNGIKLREGYYRKVENNICINNAIHPHVWLKNNNDIIRGNIFGSAFFPIRVEHWGREIDNNWYTESGFLAETQKHGIEKNSFSGDPEFVNPEQGDFRIKETSDAFKIGWKNFPMDRFGVVSSDLKNKAETPEFPKIAISNDVEATLYDYFGGQIKSLESDAELSSTGLGDKKGVLIIKVPVFGAIKNFDLQKGDVILKVGEIEIRDAEFLIKSIDFNENAKKVTVWRDQREVFLR